MAAGKPNQVELEAAIKAKQKTATKITDESLFQA